MKLESGCIFFCLPIPMNGRLEIAKRYLIVIYRFLHRTEITNTKNLVYFCCILWCGVRIEIRTLAASRTSVLDMVLYTHKRAVYAKPRGIILNNTLVMPIIPSIESTYCCLHPAPPPPFYLLIFLWFPFFLAILVLYFVLCYRSNPHTFSITHIDGLGVLPHAIGALPIPRFAPNKNIYAKILWIVWTAVAVGLPLPHQIVQGPGFAVCLNLKPSQTSMQAKFHGNIFRWLFLSLL